MHKASTQTIISHTPFFFFFSLSLSVFCFLHLQLWDPVRTLTRSPHHHSVHSDRHRLDGDWPIARLPLQNHLWPQTESGQKMRLGHERWAALFPMLSRPEGQYFKQDDLSPVKLSLAQLLGTPRTPASVKAPCIRIPSHGCPSSAGLGWAEVIEVLCYKSRLFFFVLPSCSKEINLLVTKSSISTLKLFFVKILFCVSLQAGRCPILCPINGHCWRVCDVLASSQLFISWEKYPRLQLCDNSLLTNKKKWVT